MYGSTGFCGKLWSKSPIVETGKRFVEDLRKVFVNFMKGIFQGTITYPTKREKENHRLKIPFLGDMLVPRRFNDFGKFPSKCPIVQFLFFPRKECFSNGISL